MFRMKTLLIIAAIAVGIIIFISLFGQNKVQSKAFGTLLRSMLQHNVKEVTVKNSQKDTTTLFLDCRAKEEYAVSHLKDAQWVGYESFSLENINEIPKETSITVYCSFGYRSEKIATQLETAGYTNISNLYGGIFEWKNQNHPVYDSIGITENVHAYDKKWGIWLTNGKKVYGED